MLSRKLNDLWVDNRTLQERLILSVLCSLVFCFTFIVFGPYELYIQNMQEFSLLSFRDLALPMLLVGGVTFLILSVILFSLRGKIFNCIISFVFGGAVAGYLQGNFFNIDHGLLNGAEIQWVEYKWPMLINLLFWIIIFAIIFFIMYFSKKVWTGMVELVSITLISAQMVALLFMLFSTSFNSNQNMYLSTAGMFDLSENKNVIIFLLDHFDNDFADEILETHPDLYSKMSGFTYYHNFTGSYANTKPAIAYLLTGVRCDYNIPWSEYFENAYSQGYFLKDIKKGGYAVRIYTDNYTYGDINNVVGLIDNIGCSQIAINYQQMVKSILILSIYRYSPEALKPYFILYPEELTDIATSSMDDLYFLDDPKFWYTYNDNGLSIDMTTKGVFILYHLYGAHPPYTMSEDGKYLGIQEENTQNRNSQILGNINMIMKYVEELKEKDMYDNTTIIITTDHGRAPGNKGDMSDISSSRVLSLFIKPESANDNIPLQISDKQICQDNLRSSIISYLSMDTKSYGRTIESIYDNEEINRYVWMKGDVSPILDNMYTFEIKGTKK